MTRSGMPYESFSHDSISTDKVFKLLFCAFRMIQNPNDHWSIKNNNDFNTRLESIKKSLIHTDLSGLNTAQLLDHIWDTANMGDFFGIEANTQIRKRLMRMAQPFENRIDAFLDTLMLQREVDNYDSRSERIHIMTLHACKGLEFPVVFIMGCEEGILPLIHNGENTNVDEERRLMYVGMTRSARYLYLLHSKKRFWNGQYRDQNPSRFLKPISQSLIQLERMMPPKIKRDKLQMKLF